MGKVFGRFVGWSLVVFSSPLCRSRGGDEFVEAEVESGIEVLLVVSIRKSIWFYPEEIKDRLAGAG